MFIFKDETSYIKTTKLKRNFYYLFFTRNLPEEIHEISTLLSSKFIGNWMNVSAFIFVHKLYFYAPNEMLFQ